MTSNPDRSLMYKQWLEIMLSHGSLHKKTFLQNWFYHDESVSDDLDRSATKANDATAPYNVMKDKPIDRGFKHFCRYLGI